MKLSDLAKISTVIAVGVAFGIYFGNIAYDATWYAIEINAMTADELSYWAMDGVE